MTVRLPQELIDYVIDFLHDDDDALYACSLVCHDWLPASRHHKFRYTVIGSLGDLNHEGNAPKTFDTCPIAAGYVQDLTIEGDLARRSIPDFSNCVKLRRLTLGLVDVSLMAIDFESISSSPVSRSMTDLMLSTQCCVATYEDLGRLLCAFSRLDSFTSMGALPKLARRIEDETIHQFTSSPPFSGHLVLYDESVADIIKLLLSFPRGIHFSSIDTFMFDEHPEFDMLLMACGSSLESLSICSDVRLINFHHNSNLRDLTWRNCCQTLPLESLSTIRSPVLLELVLIFSWDRETYEQADWDGLDRLLSQGQFPALRLFAVKHYGRGNYMIKGGAELARVVQLQLPRLRNRGDLLRLHFGVE